VGIVSTVKTSERCGEDTHSPASLTPKKPGCESLGVRLPEMEQSYAPHVFPYLRQYGGLPAVRSGVCMSGRGPRTCDADNQDENLCRTGWLGQHGVKLCHSACGHLSQMSEFDPDEASLHDLGLVFFFFLDTTGPWAIPCLACLARCSQAVNGS